MLKVNTVFFHIIISKKTTIHPISDKQLPIGYIYGVFLQYFPYTLTRKDHKKPAMSIQAVVA